MVYGLLHSIKNNEKFMLHSPRYRIKYLQEANLPPSYRSRILISNIFRTRPPYIKIRENGDVS